MIVIRLLFPLIIITSLILLEVTEGYPLFKKPVETLFMLGCVFLFVRLVNIFYLSGKIGYRRTYELPELFKSLTSFTIWLVALAGLILYNTDDISSYTGVFATSSVLIAIVGFAVRNLVADFFSGITLGLETPFRIGDWIEPEPGVVGKVLEMSWRSTKIVTKDNVIIIIPNSQLSSMTFRNYNLPDPYFRTSFQITLDYDVTSYQAHRTLLSAANEVPEVQNSYKKPDLKIKEFNSRGVVWELRFWLDDYKEQDNLLLSVQKNILRNLHFSNLNVSSEKITVSKALEVPKQAEIVHMLNTIDLFECLSEEDMEHLAENAKRHLYQANKTVINEGDDGSSLFLVSEGLLKVLIKKEDDTLLEVATLRSGMFFGETALLTGEKRTATVKATVDTILYEIPKNAMKEVLETNRPLARKLSRAMAKRQISSAKRVVKEEREEGALLEEVTESYFKKIFAFFNMNSSSR